MRGIPVDWLEEHLGERKLGEILLDLGILNKSQLACVLGMQRDTGKRLGELLVDFDLATLEQVKFALEEQRRNASTRTGASPPSSAP